MTQIYTQILTRLASGQSSLLVSRYGPHGPERTLVEETPNERSEGGLSFTQNGGTLTLTERFLPRPRLLILGGGHIALPLADLGKMLDFDVWVYDDRPSFANPARFPAAHTVICDNFANMRDRLAIRPGDYVTVLTRGHKHDIFCLEALLDGAGEIPQYIGMIGSKRRIAIVKEEVAAATGRGDLLDGLYAPIGLSIGSVTPEEIALSIMAEIIKLKRLGPDGTRGKVPQEGSIDPELFRWLAAPKEGRAALVTIVSTKGSTPREMGAKMAVTADGKTIGSIGGGCAEADVIARARDVMDENGWHVMEVDMADSAEEDGMVCGGVMTVLIEAVGE
ncbi:MAG: XdhC family protein [Oscillospiraceae bacterium]|nr:XdhC family protein [Oscillospiraceae bacterium]